MPRFSEYNVQQRDVNIIGQHVKRYHIKINLLNDTYQTIDVLEGELINGSYTEDATADIRSICKFVFYVRDKSYIINRESKIWFDKKCAIYMGITELRTQEILWYSMGVYQFFQNAYVFDATTNTLTCQCIDLMGSLDGTRNGRLTDTLLIPAGSNIRNAMASVISEKGNINHYLIDEIGSEFGTGTNIAIGVNYTDVPYDLQFTTKDTVYTVVKKLRDLYAGWDTYFSGDTFVCERIPTGENEDVILDWKTINDDGIVISESSSDNFEDVKNVIKVFGAQIDADRYTEICTNTGSQYNATFTDFTALENGIIYAVKLNGFNSINPMLCVNGNTAYPIVDSDGSALVTGIINDYSAFKFKDSKFYYLGTYQVFAVAMQVDSEPSDEQKAVYKEKYNCDNISYVVCPDSPFTVNKIGEIVQPDDDSEYNGIYSNDLATQRAKYELWKNTRLLDTINLVFQLIPWLRTNHLISYKSKITKIVNQYIIKQVNFDFFTGTMTLTGYVYYPLYPSIT